MKSPPPHSRRRLAALGLALGLLLLVRCASAPAAEPAPRPGYSITACGQAFDIGTRVVRWDEPGGYDAYREGKRFSDAPPDGKRRYGARSTHPTTLEELREAVHAFVVHFDACGTSRQCFKVLQDVRSLSVHFLLDIDGTIYQTLDLRERAWHATMANDFAVGVEIAHPGAWPQPLNADMRRWYAKDDQGWYMKLPKWMKETGVRTKGFVARPDRPDFQSGEVQGKTMYQFDYTPEQYEALARLCAGLSRALPRIRLQVPRGRDGAGTFAEGRRRGTARVRRHHRPPPRADQQDGPRSGAAVGSTVAGRARPEPAAGHPMTERPKPWILRSIRSSDDAAVAETIRAVMVEHDCSGEGFAIHDPEVACMSGCYGAADAGYFVVEHDGRVLGGGGYARLAGTTSPDATCELRKMYFQPDARGLGLGHALLELLIAEMKRAGYRRCYLETVTWMKTAQHLYRQHGFEEQPGPMGATGHHGCDRFFAREL